MTSPTADIGPQGPRVDSPEHWVELFTAAFGAGQYDSVAGLAEYTHPEYRGVQPRTPDAVGPASLLDFFARVYALVPDLRGEVLHAKVFDGGVYVEVRLSGCLCGRPVTWDACDRFWLQDGLVIGRVSYLDPTVLLSKVAGHPRAWRRWWHSGLGPPSRPSPSTSTRETVVLLTEEGDVRMKQHGICVSGGRRAAPDTR